MAKEVIREKKKPALTKEFRRAAKGEVNFCRRGVLITLRCFLYCKKIAVGGAGRPTPALFLQPSLKQVRQAHPWRRGSTVHLTSPPSLHTLMPTEIVICGEGCR